MFDLVIVVKPIEILSSSVLILTPSDCKENKRRNSFLSSVTGSIWPLPLGSFDLKSSGIKPSGSLTTAKRVLTLAVCLKNVMA